MVAHTVQRLWHCGTGGVQGCERGGRLVEKGKLPVRLGGGNDEDMQCFRNNKPVETREGTN
jgi:hypothetical protein